MLLQNGVWLRLAEAALPPFLFLLVTLDPIACKHVILPERSQEPGGSLILYVSSTTPVIRTPSQFLDRLLFMIPAKFPPISLPYQDPRIQ